MSVKIKITIEAGVEQGWLGGSPFVHSELVRLVAPDVASIADLGVEAADLIAMRINQLSIDAVREAQAQLGAYGEHIATRNQEAQA